MRSCVFLLQHDKRAWVLLLEMSLAPASYRSGFSCPGPPGPGNVLFLVVNFVSVWSWTHACSQAPQPKMTSRCCLAIGDGLSLFRGWESPSLSSHTGSPQPLGLMLTRSCPPGAVLTLGQWLCQGHGSVPAHCLGSAGGPGMRVPLSSCCSQDGAPHLTCMAVAKPGAGVMPALWDLRYFISIFNLQRPRSAKQVFVRGWQLCVVDISRELVTTCLRCSPRALK